MTQRHDADWTVRARSSLDQIPAISWGTCTSMCIVMLALGGDGQADEQSWRLKPGENRNTREGGGESGACTVSLLGEGECKWALLEVESPWLWCIARHGSTTHSSPPGEHGQAWRVASSHACLRCTPVCRAMPQRCRVMSACAPRRRPAAPLPPPPPVGPAGFRDGRARHVAAALSPFAAQPRFRPCPAARRRRCPGGAHHGAPFGAVPVPVEADRDATCGLSRWPRPPWQSPGARPGQVARASETGRVIQPVSSLQRRLLPLQSHFTRQNAMGIEP